MKKKLPILMIQKFNQTTGFVSSVQKKAVFFMSLLILLMLLSFKGFAQTDGDYRSLKTGGGWASTGTWEVYFASHDIWVSTTTSAWVASTAYTVGVVRTNGGNLYEVVAAGTTAASGGPTGTGTGIVDGTVTWDYLGLPPAVAPSATTNVYIQDGVAQTSNGSGFVAGSITVGQGNAFSGTAVLTGNAVTSVTINNSGALMSAPGLTFLGAGTTVAAGTVTFKMAGAFYRNKGAGYTTATVTVGTAWVGNVAVTTTTQRINGGNLYTCTTAGTTAASGGPTGAGMGITDGTAVWNYAGTAPTAHATIDAGKISGIVVDNAGGGYLSFPTLTITGDGAGAVYAIQMGIDNITITNGGNYTVAPQVIYGSYFSVGNNGNNRTVTVSGDVTFKNGSNLVSGGGSTNLTETLNIGGNLTAETPISFSTVVPASTSSTAVNFTKAGTATISGAGSMAFQNLSVGTTTTLVNNGTITISGTTNFHDILGFNFATPAVTGTVDATAHTVALSLPGGTNVTALVPTITLRTGTTVSPLSGVAQDFTNPVTYTTTAPGGTVTQAWTVTVIALSTDATLSALSVANNTLSPIFASGTTSYSVVLPFGTTIANLPAVTYTAAANATAVKTDATALPGTTTINVTAQDGTTTKAYTINFSVAAGSNDATLSALSVANNTLSPAFASGTTAYNVVLPYGTTIANLPAVTYTAAANATAVKTDATALPGTTTITVTAQDGTTTKPYTINFTVAAASTDATLSDLKVGSTTIAGFAAGTLTYNYTLTGGTTVIPQISGTVTESHATTVVTQAATLLGTANIVVTAQDGTTKKTYSVTFKWATGINGISQDQLTYEVSSNTVTIESGSTINNVEVTDINGKLMVEKNIGSTTATVSTVGWSSGIYVFAIQTKDGVETKKIGIVK